MDGLERAVTESADKPGRTSLFILTTGRRTLNFVDCIDGSAGTLGSPERHHPQTGRRRPDEQPREAAAADPPPMPLFRRLRSNSAADNKQANRCSPWCSAGGWRKTAASGRTNGHGGWPAVGKAGVAKQPADWNAGGGWSLGRSAGSRHALNRRRASPSVHRAGTLGIASSLSARQDERCRECFVHQTRHVGVNSVNSRANRRRSNGLFLQRLPKRHSMLRLSPVKQRCSFRCRTQEAIAGRSTYS